MGDKGDVVVHIDRVTKRFGKVTAVDDLDMRIMAGEFVTFLGPSGCGKTTTLRILGGFEAPDQGRVILDGRDVTSTPPNKRDVNMVFQDYALFPHMTVAQNMAFGLELKGMTRGDIDRRLRELMAFLELEALYERTPDQLSGGQRQRVALARALALNPRLLLLDEPLGALDAKLRAQVQIELKDIQRRTGKTFFFVTHDQDEALIMSDRIVVMNAGRVEQSGTPEDLYLHPQSRFVAEFIGETNLFEGRVQAVEVDGVVIDWRGICLRGTARDHKPAEGQVVTAALRPERIRCHHVKPEHEGVMEGRVASRLFKGSSTVLDVAVDDADGAIVRVSIDNDAADSLNPDRLWLSHDPNSLSILKD